MSRDDPNWRPWDQTHWRVGRKVGRTIYVQYGTTSSDDDTLIGLMDTTFLAAHVVQVHNAAVEAGLSTAHVNLVRTEQAADVERRRLSDMLAHEHPALTGD